MMDYTKLKRKIETNRAIISNIFSDAESTKRLNNLNWLRHEISYTEPRTLFHIPNKEQQPYLDFNCMRNLGIAYDYIINNPTAPVDTYSVCKIHHLLCADTHIDGGRFRTCTKVLEIFVNGNRMYAPDAYEIPYKLNDIVYKANNISNDPLCTAFDVHYSLIALQPFDDFNKRTARMIMNWVLVQNGYSPIVFNATSDKRNYIASLGANANGNHKEYNKYMLSCMARTQDKIINLFKKSRIL